MASGCVPAHAAYFSVYEHSKKNFLPKEHDKGESIHPHIYAMTGAMATVTHDFIITPCDGKFYF